jgi:amino acid transporter
MDGAVSLSGTRAAFWWLDQRTMGTCDGRRLQSLLGRFACRVPLCVSDCIISPTSLDLPSSQLTIKQAGGQYHWVAVISWRSWVPILSWITGWINVFGWMALTATAGLLGSQLIVGIIPLYLPDYVEQRWHQFLIYIGYNLIAFVINAFGNSIIPLVNKTAIIWSISGFAIISITVLACATPEYNSAKLVFTDFRNETGWPDGVAWLLGLLQGGLGLTGFDATAHMIEEIPNAAIEGPRIMIYCVAIGLGTGFIFLMCLLFVAGNLEDVITSPYGPLGAIFYNATGNKAGTVCLTIFPLICLVFAAISIMTTSSRMTWGKRFIFVKLQSIANSHSQRSLEMAACRSPNIFHACMQTSTYPSSHCHSHCLWSLSSGASFWEVQAHSTLLPPLR